MTRKQFERLIEFVGSPLEPLEVRVYSRIPDNENVVELRIFRHNSKVKTDRDYFLLTVPLEEDVE